MSYSLGDDKKSFDIFDTTMSIHQKICEELIKNNWIYDKEQYSFSKNNRTLTLRLSQDHITSLYISDNDINWERFLKQNGEFEAVYDVDDKIDSVELYIGDRTNIKRLVTKLEYAPLLEKDKDITDEMFWGGFNGEYKTKIK